jgi:hypothetical protein
MLIFFHQLGELVENVPLNLRDNFESPNYGFDANDYFVVERYLLGIGHEHK